jgi:hypothetical protein
MKVSWVIVALRLPSPLLSKTRGRGLTRQLLDADRETKALLLA